MDDRSKSPKQMIPQRARPYSTADYRKFIPPNRRPKRRGRIGVIIAAAVLALVVATVLWLWLRPDTASRTADTGRSAQTQTPDRQPTNSAIASGTQHYDSAVLRLGFDYPQDWQVDDKSDGRLTATSPALRLVAADGRMVSGRVVLTIRNQTQPLSEFEAGDAAAVRDSQVIAYTNPTSAQRGSTYISFLRYAGTTDSRGLDGVYITGNAGYKAGQAVPLADIQAVDPVVNVAFLRCADSSCSGGATPLTIAASGWSDNAFSRPIEAMLKSLSVN